MKFKQWLEEQTPPQGNDGQSVAEKFLLDVQQRYPQCQLGIAGGFGKVGSGNCAWTAKDFWNWAKREGLSAQVLFFLPYDEHSAAHLVPVYNGEIIDFIKHYHYGKNVPYMIHPVRNRTMNQVLPVEKGGLDYYKQDHDSYVLSNSIDNIQKIIGYNITTYEEPRRT